MTRLQVVVAHPDDETFGCGSLLLHAASLGVHTVVTCATRGEAGDPAPGTAVPDGGLGVLREAELRAAARILGVSEVETFDFEDSGMDGPTHPGTLCGASVTSVTEAVRASVQRHRPDVVVTLDGADGHRDHLLLRGVVEEVLRNTTITLYLHALPRSLMHDWIRHQLGQPGRAAYTDLPEVGTPDADLTTVIDTASHRQARERAIATHRSQRSPFHDVPEELRRSFLEREHLVRVYPAWPGGPTESSLSGLATDGRRVDKRSHIGVETRATNHPEAATPNWFDVVHQLSKRCYWAIQEARWVCDLASRDQPPE